MAQYVTVTRAQRAAAREIVRRDAAKGIPSRPAVVKIANARLLAPDAGDDAECQDVATSGRVED